MNQRSANISSGLPFASLFNSSTISSRLADQLSEVDHSKFLVLTFTVFTVISIPLFIVLPILSTFETNPDTAGNVLFSKRSEVLDLYNSKEPDIRFLRNPKSRPRLI